MYNPVVTFNMDAAAFLLLAQQKHELQKLIAEYGPDNILPGLIHLIDHIQDQCVEKNGIQEEIVFPKVIEECVQEEIQFPQPNIYAKDTPVLSSDGKKKGKLTGSFRHCGLEGCTGKALAVRWEDGELTHPCTKNMTFNNDTWQIG